MNRLKGLTAISVLVFLLSGIGLLLLVVDDKKDLSTRASINQISSKVKPLDKFSTSKQEINYNTKVWAKLENNLYLNQLNGDTLRIFNENLKSSSVSGVLGSAFESRRSLGSSNTDLKGWTKERFEYSLFGELKKVNLWTNGRVSVLEVGKLTNTSAETISFLVDIANQFKVLGTTTGPDDSAKVATLIRPSVVMVLNNYCAELKFFNNPNFLFSDKVYPFCITSMGSGFFISEDGILATNGHIVKNLPNTALYYGLLSGKLDNLLNDFLNLYLSQLVGRPISSTELKQKVDEVHQNKEVLYQVGGLIADLNQKNILKFQNESNSYYLQLGNQPAVLTSTGLTETDSIIKASLIGVDYLEQNIETGFVSSDVALLKVNKQGVYPSLSLGNLDEAYVGSNLQIVGFPAAAMSGGLLDSASMSEPTFTKGVVSAIKLAKGNQKKLIQTDAIINHGNSGGPAVLLNGQVVGVATYGIAAEDGSGSYNYLRDIQDIKDLVVKQNLKLNQGELSTLWQQGLDNYWLGYFKYSSEKFKKVQSLYPQHPLVEKYLQSSNSKINTVEDLTPKFTHKQRTFFMTILGTIMALSIISTISTLVLIVLEKNKKHQVDSVHT